MPFVVSGRVDDVMLTATAETAKEAFAKAVDWHVAKGFSAVSISKGQKRFTIAEFSWAMASQEIAGTVNLYRQQGRQSLRQSKSRP